MTTSVESLSLRYAALSDLGRHRKDNQDSGYASEHLLVIADGVGGAAYGDVASSTAVHVLRRLDAPAEGDMLAALAGAIHRTHDKLAELVEQDSELEGTSTTITAALFDGQRLGVAHVGDSRAYLLRGDELTQLTNDHTFVQSLVDEGRITEDEARTHPHRNLILRAVDGVHDTEPDLFHVDVTPGDRVMLCSDGCSGVLTDRRLAAILGSGTVDYATVELVRGALDAGTTDNVTVVVAEVVRSGDEGGQDESAAAVTGPMLVGAAAAQPRRAGATVLGFLRGHREAGLRDTGELEPVPGDSTHDPEELRYAPRPPRRFIWGRRLLVLGLLGLVVGGLGWAAYSWTQGQFFVADDGPYVVVYRGVQAELPGVHLSSVEEASMVTLAALPAYAADDVREGIDAQDLDDARQIITRLQGLARTCPEPEVTPEPRPRPSPEPSAGPSPEASAAPSPSDEPSAPRASQPRAGASPSESPSPSPSAEALAPPDCIVVTGDAS